MEDLHELKKQNDELKLKLNEYKSRLDEYELQQRILLHSLPCNDDQASLMVGKEDDKDISTKALSIIVLGASGDLAKKKTYPALYCLHENGMLPKHAVVTGFARSELPLDKFRAQIGQGLPGKDEGKKKEFLDRCFYFKGNYDSAPSFADLHLFLKEQESKFPNGANRIYYFAIPPTVFVASARSIKEKAMSTSGWTRVVVEKPFGRDTESASALGKELGSLFTEDQIFRIDHYLGKEMVQNLMVLRFANEVFEPVWNRHHIASVQITFKEPFGTQGRGGYFDEFGIIRDVMQNHLIQILALVAMEPPVSMRAEDVRDEKAKLLRAVPPITRENLVIGQYGPDQLGREPAYLEDPTVPKDSITPTYAAAILHINNSRWKGTPFILKCGKALDERKAEVRITFKKPATGLFLENDLAPNELVIRVQPDESVYFKMTIKKPGLSADTVYTELDLSYKDKFTEEGKSLALPDAYERLIFDVIRGDHNLFVRDDELLAAWNIFTPILHQLENEKIRPEPYEFGSRGPHSAAELIKQYYVRVPGYKWKDHVAKSRV